MRRAIRNLSMVIFPVLTGISLFFILNIKFSFDFEQFFPQGDPDLAFFLEFRENFEDDDNFLMIAVENKGGIFNKPFLDQLHEFTLAARDLESVNKSLSVTTTSFPVKLPFGGYSTIPAVHRDAPERLARDSAKLMKDSRLVHTLLSKDGKSAVVFLKTVERIELDKAEKLILAVEELIQKYNFTDYHLLGRANFQKEMVAMQKREVAVSSIVSFFLVSLVMFLIFRKTRGILIALVSIGMGLLLFMGVIGAWGREFNAMSALYPVLMIIVGTSDVIHIMSKYIDELGMGKSRKEAIRITIREIGMATLLTSITTAVGFATLLTSRVRPISEFGVNSSVGVLVAYITVLFFTTAWLSFYKKEQLIKAGRGTQFWEKWMLWTYHFTKEKSKQIAMGALLFFILCLVGISKVTTNFQLENNFPRGEKITKDFKFFENNFSGFRPFEVAVTVLPDSLDVYNFKVMQEIDKLEKHLETYPEIQSVSSVTTVFKSLNRASGSDKESYYKLPTSERKYKEYQKLARRFPQTADVLVSKDKKKARIAARIQDVGADNVAVISNKIDQWMLENLDTEMLAFRRTGTGVIMDKNAEYIVNSLFKGLIAAIFIISLLMALLFQNLRMVLVSLVPNIFPLLVAGALLGYLGIALDAPVAVIFAIVFGIAVDDTIHFLSKYKLTRAKGIEMEDALRITFLETGKAICLTTIILFFGFLVMLFSVHPPSVTVGLLISVTLGSAVICDFLLIPVMLRWLVK